MSKENLCLEERKLCTPRTMKRDFGRAFLALLVGAAIIGCPVSGTSNGNPESYSITKFTINGFPGVIDQGKKTIDIVLPHDTDVTALLPEVEFVGANISPAPGEPVNFSVLPVTYTVYSRDGSAFSYLVTVTLEIPNTNEILAFDFEGVTAFSTDIIDDTGVIKITVPYGTTGLDHKTTVIEHNGDSINPVPGEPQNFEVPVTYEVYSKQGEKRVYTVEVIIAPNVENDITRFTLNGAEGVITGANITVTVPHNMNLTALTPDVTVSDGASFSPAGPQNFSNRVTYKVTAADNATTRNYTVTVNVSAIDAKDITAFTIAGQEKSEINGNTITVTLPANMPKNPLTPTIVFAGNTVSPASGAAQNFSGDVKYTVTAADASTKEYTVKVTNSAAKDVTLNSVKANGATWKTETTMLTLQFSADMGAALKAEHITLTPASGSITKDALTNKGLGEYELVVRDIPGDNVSVTVKVGETSVYGYKVTGSPKTVNVFKAPTAIDWKELKANGTDKTLDTSTLSFTFDKDVTGFAAADITLTGVSATKGAVSGTGNTRALAVSAVSANNADLTVSLSKTGFAFTPTSKTVKVYKKLSTDAALKNLTVNGYTLSPAFSASTTDYTVAVGSDTIQVTATANDAGAKLVYVENNNLTVTSGTAFSSKTLSEGANTVTVKVTAEDGTTTKSYKLTVTYKDVDFPDGTTINKTFGVSNTTEWNSAVSEIKNGGGGKNYVINVIGNFNVAGTTSATFGGFTGTVVIRGSKTIGLSSKGNLIRAEGKQIIILRDITLTGRADNTDSVFYAGGWYSETDMRGSVKITGNTANDGGGVYISSGGVTFTMRDNAVVSGNTAKNGGGVYITGNSKFTMQDNASVSGNTASGDGGGVHATGDTAKFTMQNNASVSGNTTSSNGGGVYLTWSNLTMRDNASVSGNTAKNGGGVHVNNAGASLIMRDDVVVFGNTANNNGGGVYVSSSQSIFRIAGGTVYGSAAADSLKNTAKTSAALENNHTAEYGTGGTDGVTWVKKGDLSSTNDTIKVVNGVKK